jgi:hypothetical protein
MTDCERIGVTPIPIQHSEVHRVDLVKLKAFTIILVTIYTSWYYPNQETLKKKSDIVDASTHPFGP